MKEPLGNELLRVLKLKDAVGIGLESIIGAGIFVVTGTASGVTGPHYYWTCNSGHSRLL